MPFRAQYRRGGGVQSGLRVELYTADPSRMPINRALKPVWIQKIQKYRKKRPKTPVVGKIFPSVFGKTHKVLYLCIDKPLTMSQYLVYIKLPVYVREWCEHHFGVPVEFPRGSNVNAVIRHFLKERPSGIVPEQQQADETAIRIPDSQAKRTSKFNYLTRSGKLGIASAIDDLFTLHMYEDLTGPGTRAVPVSALVEDWIHCNGISEEQEHNVRMKFYRIKDSYRKNGVNVSRRYKRD